ncbi:MAG: TetR/AcrR family transcriptional regulator [Nitrospina sp.]|nr:TetR/AcrR family transcriptional regulator [Nitrospina sp.]MBT7522164.1 TetR/AcrR family transcriptional regulator [Nitrospina sp.]MDB3917383.1 TetR/AcrR family transcriptional regulator [bacterium]
MVTKIIQTEQTREKLFLAGFQVLKEKGVKGLTASQIAGAAGVSKAGFFHHFPKIEDFFLYLLDQMVQMIEAQVFQAKPTTMVEFLETSASTTLKMMDETPEFMIAIYYFIDFSRFNETYTIRLQKILKSSYKKWVDDLSGYFPPNFPEEKKEILVYLLDAFLAGLGTQYLVLQDRELYLKISVEFINMIMNFIEGSP